MIIRYLAALLLALTPLAPAAAQTHFSVAVEGSGPDVILIPGLMSGRSVFDDAAASLGGKYRLHRVQLAGFAGEPVAVDAEGALLPAVVEALHAYIAANRLKRPALVGHSMGGLLGLMLADRYPEAVGKLLIVDALPFYAMMMGPAATAASVGPQAAMLRDGIAAMDDAAFAAQQAQTFAMLVKTEAVRPALLAQSLASDRKVAAQAIYEVMTTDMRPKLASIETPITVAYATNAFATEARVGPLYASYAAAPNARIVAVEDSYHFIMQDQPERFHALLKEFLSTTK
ncbi:MAG: alpha/beta hydrolase [Pseudomonadota bacterium]|nr:alpha/beta hydrolase [Pseudomonadota bacterium]